MTKGDLVAAVAQKTGVTKKDVAMVVDGMLNAVTAELAKGGGVTLTGFGTFKVSKRAARTGVNPRNPGQSIKIPAMKLAEFRPGKTLKDKVRG